MGKRVVVTGLGLVTPVGNDVPTTWGALLAGSSGVDHITRFDVSNLDVRIAAEVKALTRKPSLVVVLRVATIASPCLRWRLPARPSPTPT